MLSRICHRRFFDPRRLLLPSPSSSSTAVFYSLFFVVLAAVIMSRTHAFSHMKRSRIFSLSGLRFPNVFVLSFRVLNFQYTLFLPSAGSRQYYRQEGRQYQAISRRGKHREFPLLPLFLSLQLLTSIFFSLERREDHHIGRLLSGAHRHRHRLDGRHSQGLCPHCAQVWGGEQRRRLARSGKLRNFCSGIFWNF